MAKIHGRSKTGINNEIWIEPATPAMAGWLASEDEAWTRIKIVQGENKNHYVTFVKTADLILSSAE